MSSTRASTKAGDRAKTRAVRRDIPVPVRHAPQPGVVSSRTGRVSIAPGLCALTLLAYSNSFHGAFTFDTKGLLSGDPRIREATRGNVALILQHTYWWPTGEAGLYRPFTTLSWLFNYAILGGADQPAGYHWVNFLLHAGNVLLVYALARVLVRSFWPPVFAAGLWAVHPVLTESVTNIAGRADLLAGASVLGGFLMYLKCREAQAWRLWAWIAGLAAVTTVGVFSKESAAAIPGVLALYELTWRKGIRRSAIFAWLAVLAPTGAMVYVRARVLASAPRAEFPFTDNPIVGADWWTGRLTSVKVIAHYLWIAIWPARLSADYSWNQIPLARGTAEDWLLCLAVLATLTGVGLLYRWNRTAFFLACFGLVNLIPVSNLLFPIGTIAADRLLYLPSVGFVACLVLAGFALAEKAGKERLAPLALAVMVAGFAARTWVRNRDWENDLTLATATAEASPNSFKAHRLLAAALFDSDPSHANLGRVIEEQEKSVALLDPVPAARSRPEAYRMAGYYYLLKADQTKDAALYKQAIPLLRKAIAIDRVSRAAYLTDSAHASSASPAVPDGDSEAYLLLSVAHLRAGEPAKALDIAVEARALNPLDPRIYRQFADIFASQQRDDASAVAAAEADAIVAVQREQWQEAAELCDHLMRLDAANFPAGYYLDAMANLRLGRLDPAEKSAREAVRLDAAHRNPRTSYVLGTILAQKGDFQGAAEALRAYLNAAPNAPDAEAARAQLAEIEPGAR